MRRPRPSDSDEEDYYSKRDRLDTDTVESLIYRVGSKDITNIEKDVSDLASLVLLEIPRNGDKLLKVLSRCVKDIPERVVIYATMIGLLNLKNRGFVNQLIEVLQRELKDALKSANFEDAKFILLFLAVSINCSTVSFNSLLSLYENFSEVTLDIGRSSQSRTDWYTYVILYSLPYCAQSLASQDLTTLTDILGTIDVYMSKRSKAHVPLLCVWETDDPHPQEDYLDCLWAQIRNMRTSGWQEKVTWRLYDSFPSLKELGLPHHIPPLTPPDYDPETVYPIPRVVFRMFDYTDVIEQEDDNESTLDAESSLGQAKAKETPILPGAHTIERFLIDEQLAILMNSLSFNRTLCAKSMLGLRTRARLALDYMIVEAVFAGMFNLPHPPVQHGNLLFYGSLLIQLCQEATNTMPLVLAQATELLYERLNTMKPVCINRMIEWFSYHLSNYQLQWSWREWSGAISEDPMSPHRRLITETFARLIRFSYYENVKRLLPKFFYPLLPPQPMVVNKYESNADLPSAHAFRQILNALRSKAPAGDVLKLTRRVADPDNQVDADEDDETEQGHGLDSSDDGASGGSDHDLDGMDEDEVHRLKNRPRLAARRRNAHPSQQRKTNDDDNLMNSTETSHQLTDLSHGVTTLTTELFFSALFIAGHKTISHTFSFIKKYASAVRTLASAVETQVEALHVLQAVWINHPQMIVIITEHMCRTGLIDPEAIIRWAYSPIMTSLSEIPIGYNPSGARPRILDFYVWECLHRTLLRVGRRVMRITNRLNAAKELMDLEGLRSVSPSSDRDRNSGDEEENNKRRRYAVSKRPDKRNVISGYEMVSSENEDEDDDDDGKVTSSSRIARLEEARCEAVRSQCAVITLLLHRHACLTSEVAAEIAGDDIDMSSVSLSSTALLHSSGLKLGLSKEALKHIAFWLKGRLVQVALEHCDQLMPYLDNLDEFICGAHPEVQDVFQQLRALHS